MSGPANAAGGDERPSRGELFPPEPFPGGLQSLRLRAALWRVARWAGAILLTLAALLLGFVPGLPGVPLFLIALFLIAPDFRPARRLLTWLQRRMPKKMRRMVPKSLRRRMNES